METKTYKAPNPSWIMRLFWKAAGADSKILMQTTYSEHVKYFCLGGIVVATGFMAAMAGGYAFYTIFAPKGDALEKIVQATTLANGEKSISDYIHYPTVALSVAFAIVWGLIIFNLDRFIVASTGTGDGTEAITWKELTGALPRVFMGIVIAITISKPLEIRIFKSEIDAQLHIEQQKLRKEYEEGTRDKYAADLERVKKDLEKVEVERADLLARVKKAEEEHTNQLQGRGGAPAGDGRLSQALEKIKNDLIAELNNFDATNKTKIDKLNTEREETIAKMNKELAENQRVSSGLDGLLERIKIGHEISGFWISFFISLLFITIELTPIFFKLMLIKGPYDYLSDNVKETIKAEQGIKVEYKYYTNKKGKKGVESDVVINLRAEQLLEEKEKLTAAQRELSDFIIQKWKENEMKKIEANPEKYIQQNGLDDADKNA